MRNDDDGMPDYGRLLDAEVRTFIRQSEEFYPPDSTQLSLAEQRSHYDRLCQTFDEPIPQGLSVTDRAFGGVACRLYEPAGAPSGPAILYFHGGGFVLGGLDSHNSICAELAAGTRLRLVAVDYRLAPEHLHPAQYDDGRAAALAVAAEFGVPLVLAGDSAGATLAATLAHGLRGDAVALAGQVLIYPYLGGDPDRGSYVTHAHAPLLSREDMIYYEGVRFAGPRPSSDVTANPLDDGDFSGLPPTVVSIAECDPLADDGRAYVAAINDAGGAARLIEERGLVHGHLRARHKSERAREAFRQIISSLSVLARGEPI